MNNFALDQNKGNIFRLEVLVDNNTNKPIMHIKLIYNIVIFAYNNQCLSYIQCMH